MIFTTREPTYLNIIQILSEDSIAFRYIGVNVGTPFRSYFRKDKNASARLYYSKYTGRIRYGDFYKDMYLPDLLCHILQVNYRTLLARIIKDFNLNYTNIPTSNKSAKKRLYNTHTTHKKQGANIQIHKCDWSDKDIEFWTKDGGIPISVLEDPRVNIKAIDWFWINGNQYKADVLAYSYEFYYYNKVERKIYQPLRDSDNGKWRSSISKNTCQGWDTLPKSSDNELLIVTSSYKDSLTVLCNSKIPSISPNNEIAFLPSIIIPKIKQRFKKTLVWFDQDTGGHIGANKYKQKYNWDAIFIPEKFNIKDPYEFRKKYGHKDFIQLTNYLIK